MPSKKYFIAIVIPDPLFTKIEEIKDRLFQDHGLKGALRSPAHITLHRPFEWKPEKEELLLSRLSQFSFDRKFNIGIEDFDVFEPRVIFANVTRNETLFELHDKLLLYCKNHLRLFNEADDERGFHPHVTVAFRDLKKPLFYTLKDDFLKTELRGSFEYKGFSLLRLEKKWEVIRTFSADAQNV